MLFHVEKLPTVIIRRVYEAAGLLFVCPSTAPHHRRSAMGCCVSAILARIVFMPPSPSYYSRNSLKTPVTFLDTPHGTRIPVVIHGETPTKGTVIVYSHGNAEDLGAINFTLQQLSLCTKATVVGYDYSGYGIATGEASEENMISDLETVLQHLEKTMKVDPGQIVLYGRSLGSGPTMQVAARRPENALRGVVLQSPVLSVVRTKCDCLVCCNKTWQSDMFSTRDILHSVTAPLFVIHGTADQVVPFWHGKYIFDNAPRPVDKLWIQNAGHNDLASMTLRQVYARVSAFLDSQATPNGSATEASAEEKGGKWKDFRRNVYQLSEDQV